MIPESVNIRHRGAVDFESCYNSLCALQDSVPLGFVKFHLKKNMLDINGDKVKYTNDWLPILNTLKINQSLKHVAVRSYFTLPPGPLKKSHYFKRRVPPIRNKEMTLSLAKAVSCCLMTTSSLKYLDLQGVPLRDRDLRTLVKGLQKNCTLTHLLMDYCQISDKGLEILFRVLKCHPTITHISFCGCNITSFGAAVLAKIIRHQSTQRHSEAWAESLRYRIPSLGEMRGIRRVTLNSNPMIGDDGLMAFSEVLKDDLWVKAIDLQNCGLSSETTTSLLNDIQKNEALVVLDIRNNPMVDKSSMRKVIAKVLLNANDQDDINYPWHKDIPPKDPYRTGKYHVPLHQSRSKRSIQHSSNFPKPKANKENGNKENKDHVPWRTAIRASIHERGCSRYCKSPNDSCEMVRSFAKPNLDKSDNKISACDKSLLTSDHSSAYIKQLKVDILDLKRQLEMSRNNEGILMDKLIHVEVENRRLKDELANKFENDLMKSQINDDMLLDNIEQSFNKFHEFLNNLSDIGLGSLVAEAGLSNIQFPNLSISVTQQPDMSTILPTKSSVKEPTNEQPIHPDNPILIEGNNATINNDSITYPEANPKIPVHQSEDLDITFRTESDHESDDGRPQLGDINDLKCSKDSFGSESCNANLADSRLAMLQQLKSQSDDDQPQLGDISDLKYSKDSFESESRVEIVADDRLAMLQQMRSQLDEVEDNRAQLKDHPPNNGVDVKASYESFDSEIPEEIDVAHADVRWSKESIVTDIPESNSSYNDDF